MFIDIGDINVVGVGHVSGPPVETHKCERCGQDLATALDPDGKQEYVMCNCQPDAP